MEEIDQKLDHWVYNNLIRAEIRKVIEDYVLDEKVNAFKAGWEKGSLSTLAKDYKYKQNTNEDG